MGFFLEAAFEVEANQPCAILGRPKANGEERARARPEEEATA